MKRRACAMTRPARLLLPGCLRWDLYGLGAGPGRGGVATKVSACSHEVQRIFVLDTNSLYWKVFSCMPRIFHESPGRVAGGGGRRPPVRVRGPRRGGCWSPGARRHRGAGRARAAAWRRTPGLRQDAGHARCLACTCCACPCSACLRCAPSCGVWCACAALAYIVRRSLTLPTPNPSLTPAT